MCALTTLPGREGREAAVLCTRATCSHCAGCQFASLLVLGGLLGLLFVHTRNLLAPMVLHSAWNLFIFNELTRGAAAVAL